MSLTITSFCFPCFFHRAVQPPRNTPPVQLTQLTNPHTNKYQEIRTLLNQPDPRMGSVWTDYPSQSIKPRLSHHQDVIPSFAIREQNIQGAPKNPEFHSRVVLHRLSEDATLVNIGEDKKASKGCNFSKDEDVQLCKSWLSISKDPVTGTNQTASTFWESVTNDYSKYQANSDRSL